MKIFKTLIIAVLPLVALPSCMDEAKDKWETYADWRETNENWINELAASINENGDKVYTKVVPAWNKNAYVLMRWHNDTMETCGNLRPLYTSTVDVKYIGKLYNDQPFDSSYVSVTPADSIFRTLVSNTITGWQIAMERMHVGDSVTVIVPYEQGYGAASQGAYIKPYSALQFGIKLVDVAGEYIKP